MTKTLYLLLCTVFLFGCPWRVSAQIITTIAGDGSSGYTGDGGAAILATFNAPTTVTVDGAGNIYINDQQNNRVRKVDQSGIITTVAGNGTAGYSGDGTAATMAQLSSNWGTVADVAGNLYISDQNNNCIRKVNTAGIISTIAGNGTGGFAGDGGQATAAELYHPIGIAIDAAGNIYIGDHDNWRIRKINTSGVISTIAGTGVAGTTGDGGPALSAQLGNTFGLAADNAGNVYVCDNDRVRMISSSGIITSVAGNGMSGYNMDGIPAVAAELNEPTGVFVNNAGELFIADYNNNRIRKVNHSGIISTIAGTGTPGFSGDGDLAVNAQLKNPLSVTMDTSNTILYLTDFTNTRIRMISNANLVYFVHGKTQQLSVCENTTHNDISTLLAALDHDAGLTDNWTLLAPPEHGMAVAAYTATATATIITPSGLYYTPAGGYAGPDSFKVKIADGLGADTTTIHVTVNPLTPSAGLISGASDVCEGSSIILSESVTGGVWSISNGSAVITDSLVTGIHTGADTVIYTVTNPCGSSTITKVISVDPLPLTGAITGINALCIGGTVVLTDTVHGGIWSVSNALATVTPEPGESIVTALAHGVDTVYYSVTTSVCEASAMFVVRLDTFPDPGVINSSSNVCIGSYIILSDPVSGGYWSASNDHAALNSDTLTGITYGIDTINYAVTNTCGTATTGSVVIIDSLPAKPVIAQEGSIITVPAGYASYAWTFNGSLITGANSDSFTVVSIGTYAAIVTNAAGCTISSEPIMRHGCTPDDLKLYPNPTSNMLYVDWCKKVTIRITGADGKTMDAIPNTDRADLSLLPSGIYFLSIYDTNGNKIKTKKIVKL